ncbi:DUF975 family protein [Weissella halotolerans]|uniref:Integral membrane protein n=1 Tax=Weissella halotolerans DSM 20190 TaxID=1123500 RepID=A0A0R2FYP3_9LACO|nr:DUF975 family protein [Weissella halotolerans]KRN33555.1 hypothetical protein IV68_GL000361 [Weissella halotolerans DSM 20190]
MDRLTLKQESKTFLNQHLQYSLLLFLISVLTATFVSKATNRIPIPIQMDPQVQVTISLAGLASIINWITLTSAKFVTLDNLRAKKVSGSPISQQVMVFQGRYFWGTLGITLLSAFYVFCWSLLLVIPGIIKSYSYMQALNLYKDSVDAGQPLGINEAITLSRQLMDGQKLNLFVLQLSFVFWWLLSIPTFGLSDLYVIPYYTYALQLFYLNLLAQRDGKPLHQALSKDYLSDPNDEL